MDVGASTLRSVFSAQAPRRGLLRLSWSSGLRLGARAQSFLERGIQQQVDGRGWRVPSDKPLAEITGEVVVARGRSLLNDVADRTRESLFHAEARELVQDRCQLRFGQGFISPTTPVKP